MTYLEKFLALKCAGDVLDVVGPMMNRDKEINEAMAVLRVARKWILRYPGRFTLLDLCSGNALVPVIAAHYLPVVGAVAVDIRPRVRDWSRVAKFRYVQADVMNSANMDALIAGIKTPIIMTAAHPCRQAMKIAYMYSFYSGRIDGVVILPCCNGDIGPAPTIIRELGRYKQWCFDVWKVIDRQSTNSDCIVDVNCRDTPKNIVVWGSRIEHNAKERGGDKE